MQDAAAAHIPLVQDGFAFANQAVGGDQ